MEREKKDLGRDGISLFLGGTHILPSFHFVPEVLRFEDLVNNETFHEKK